MSSEEIHFLPTNFIKIDWNWDDKTKIGIKNKISVYRIRSLYTIFENFCHCFFGSIDEKNLIRTWNIVSYRHRTPPKPSTYILNIYHFKFQTEFRLKDFCGVKNPTRDQ